MNPYSIEDWTYGVELEYGNCYRHAVLPDGAKWNDKDNTCVSSTGIANDPHGILYEYGGEINTRPTKTIEEQIEHIALVNSSLYSPKPIVNYRSNLHIHIRVPGLSDDLESCKKLLRYIMNHQQEAFSIVEDIPVPDRMELTDIEYEWALKRMKRRYRSHQYRLPESRTSAMLEATTTQEFYEEHAPLTDKGRMWFFSPRAGINLRQMWEETNTIEFRHFPGTLDMNEMKSCLEWCRAFLDAALNQRHVTPRDISKNSIYTFPKFADYEFETEQIYQKTNFDTNSKKDIADLLSKLRQEIDIDDIEHVTSKEVYPIMLKILGGKQ